MAIHEPDNRIAPDDKRMVIVDGKRYHAKTSTKCTTCSHDDRYMYIKLIVNGSDLVLECPACESSVVTKDALVKRV